MHSNQISRRQFIQSAAFSLGALSTSMPMLAPNSDKPSREKPNIIFILTDDQRWDALGCAGDPIIRTPNMDRLATDGVRFENAFVTTPICAASRASIFTGLHERTHGFTFNTPPLSPEFMDMSYPVLLRRAGYQTGFVGKFGIVVPEGGEDEMFDSYVNLHRDPYFKKINGKLKHLTDITGDHALEFLRSCKSGQPFCLSISFNAPHAEDRDPRQYIWPSSCDNFYNDVQIPKPKLADPAFFEAQPEFIKTSMNWIRWRWRFDTPEKYQTMVKGYYRMISGVDMVIGRLREALKQLGLDRNTVIILTSDNGYFLGERGFAGKWLMYEPSLRVPLIIYNPRITTSSQGTVLEQMVLNIDIAPTILGLAGIDIPQAMQGRDLEPILNGEQVDWRSEMFCEHLFVHKDIPQSEGIRTERWKYFRYREHPDFEELYDLVNDPFEERNLVPEQNYKKILLELRQRCDEKIKILSNAHSKCP